MDDLEHSVGRPSSFNEERAERVIEAVRQGMTFKLAAAYAGISYSTLNRWRIEGRSEYGSPEFREFWKLLEQANGEAALRMINIIQDASEGDWKAATWFLERRYPDQWGASSGRQIDPTEPLSPFD